MGPERNRSGTGQLWVPLPHTVRTIHSGVTDGSRLIFKSVMPTGRVSSYSYYAQLAAHIISRKLPESLPVIPS